MTSPARIRVLIADDHSLVRDGLRNLLEVQTDMEVVGEAVDGTEALAMTRELRPDVLLLDIAMPALNGLEVVILLRDSVPETKIVILSMFAKDAYTHQALADGACGFVLKGDPSIEVLTAVRAVHAGRYFFSRQIHTEVDEHTSGHRHPPGQTGPYEKLTPREKQVFFILIEGKSSQGIADLLGLSIKTVEKHRAAISAKIGIHNPIEMVKFAIRHGIIDPDFWKI